MDRMRKYLTIKYIIIAVGIIILDLVIYFILALLLMNYDDFYDESKGKYWSLESMTPWQKVNYIGFNIWQIVNLIAIGYIIYRIIKEIKKRPKTMPEDSWGNRDKTKHKIK
jgi:large-conductance mechanosensitive channel